MIYFNFGPDFEAIVGREKQRAMDLGFNELEKCLEPSSLEEREEMDRLYGNVNDINSTRDIKSLVNGIAQYTLHEFEGAMMKNDSKKYP